MGGLLRTRAGAGQKATWPIIVKTWKRGEWEKQLGARMDYKEPLYHDVISPQLVANIRASATDLSAKASMLDEIKSYWPDLFEGYLDFIVAGESGADHMVDLVFDMVPGPCVATAVAIALFQMNAPLSASRRAYMRAAEKGDAAGHLQRICRCGRRAFKAAQGDPNSWIAALTL